MSYDPAIQVLGMPKESPVHVYKETFTRMLTEVVCNSKKKSLEII